MGLPRVQGVGIAVPPYAMRQCEIKEFVAGFFSSHIDQLERLLPIFESSSIQVRHLSQPLDWYRTNHSFAEANKIFEQVALVLSEKAALEAMDKAKVKPLDIGMVIFVSSTGIATPTLDGKLIERLGMSPHTKRLPIWGLGCGGGVAGVARAAEMAHTLPEKSVLLVTVELCSLTFQCNDYSKANLVGASIFADGAAAAVITLDGKGPAILGSNSTLLPDSADIMGWDLVDSGLKVRFSRDIPSIVRRYLPELLNKACIKWGLDDKQLSHYVVHPGGAKVLSAYSESLGLAKEKLVYAYEILSHYGNMSSASVLFVLEQFIKATAATDDYGAMLAMGPGFSVEQVLFQW
ncbi:MAG TPA: 3-oxoacyl-[acyl-carrier-protein] synthase III C-terminal domain-containing protein [Negativicutes bacterium]|jgi:alkylresorcinol/alkylpyrone synthase